MQGGISMKHLWGVSGALLLALSLPHPASAQSPADLVKQGVEALGGADALRGLKTLAFKADAKHWEPGQSNSINGESRFLGDSTVATTVDLAAPLRVRYDWDRDMKYPAVERAKYSEIRYPTYGAAVDAKGKVTPMSAIRLATNIREGARVSPVLLLRAMNAPQNVTAIADQKLGNQTLPAVQYAEGPNKFIILFDRATHLPAAVRTHDEDNIWGDANYDAILSDWKTVGGIKISHTRSFKLNDMEVQHMTLKDVQVNQPIAADTFAIPDAVKAEAKAPATANVPYQWVIRRLFLGRFTDSDAIYFAPNGSFKLVELAPNVQMVQGGGANNLIVNMKDGLVIVDAPTDNGQSQWVIDAAKKKYPGKPIKTLILTHHHMDHTGGMRAFAAEGAAVIVPAPDKAYFEDVIKRAHTFEPDAQQRAMKAANVQEVKDTMSLKDDTVEINLYNIPNPHVQGMLLVHVVKDNILWVTDLVSPRGPVGRNPGTVAVGNALRQHNITGALIAGGHGATAKQADIAPALAAN
jgi:glyoxylase-like metal-dependent hydrolase (beta-lactamase superfamily II)